jgi:hypothetical protein
MFFRYCNLLPHLSSISLLRSGMDRNPTIDEGTGRGPLSRVQVCNSVRVAHDLNPEFRSPRWVEKYQVQVTNLNQQETVTTTARLPRSLRSLAMTAPIVVIARNDVTKQSVRQGLQREEQEPK